MIIFKAVVEPSIKIISNGGVIYSSHEGIDILPNELSEYGLIPLYDFLIKNRMGISVTKDDSRTTVQFNFKKVIGDNLSIKGVTFESPSKSYANYHDLLENFLLYEVYTRCGHALRFKLVSIDKFTSTVDFMFLSKI